MFLDTSLLVDCESRANTALTHLYVQIHKRQEKYPKCIVWTYFCMAAILDVFL